jgi:hypothetical protein
LFQAVQFSPHCSRVPFLRLVYRIVLAHVVTVVVSQAQKIQWHR